MRIAPLDPELLRELDELELLVSPRGGLERRLDDADLFSREYFSLRSRTCGF